MADLPVTVLILDDEPLLRRSLEDFLRDEGRFAVLAAEDAASGLDALRRHAVHVCLVDLRLPGPSGIDFMVQAQELKPDVRFIVHTGSPESQLPKAVIQELPGYRGVLYKPVVDMGEIVRAIDAAIR